MPQHRRSSRAAARPVITLTTDFGLDDWYVAAVKAVLIARCPEARLIDVTHRIPQGDVLRGATTLERAIDVFPAGTVHLAVIDPGVGSGRRMLLASIKSQWVVCPDNGLITWAWHRQGAGRTWELTWRPESFSSIFHGRDIMGPAAGMLAAGKPADELGRRIDNPVLLDLSPAPPDARTGRIIHCDHFGNATTNITAEAAMAKAVRVEAAGRSLGRLRRAYADVAPGEALALIGSSGLLEIAVRDGSAAQKLKLRIGDEVRLLPD